MNGAPTPNDPAEPIDPNEPSTAMTTDPSTSSPSIEPGIDQSDDRVTADAVLVALNALDDDERTTVEPTVDGRVVDELRIVLSSVGDVVFAAPPSGLRDQVLTAARARRAPGKPFREPEPTGPATAFRTTVEELHQFLLELTDAEWLMPTATPYGQVRDLVAHLVGVEENLTGLLGEVAPPDPETWSDHLRASSTFMAALKTTPVSELSKRWVESALRLGRLAASTPQDQMINVNDVPSSVAGMLVLRTFEIWTHHEDICRAIGRDLLTLDPSRLRLMSSSLMDVLPVALSVRGDARPNRTARVVLTGDGGASFDRPMATDTEAGFPDVVLVADVTEFCRLAARRIEPRDLAITVEGDRELADLVLQAAGAFARD